METRQGTPYIMHNLRGGRQVPRDSVPWPARDPVPWYLQETPYRSGSEYQYAYVVQAITHRMEDKILYDRRIGPQFFFLL